jgi:hypothetical protein
VVPENFGSLTAFTAVEQSRLVRALGQFERAKPNWECPNPNTLLGARFLSIFYLRPSTYSSESSPLHISTHLSIAIMSDNIPTPVMPIIPPLKQRMQLAVHQKFEDPILKASDLAYTYDLPVSTLKHRLAGRQSRKEFAETQQRLRPHEEECLIKWLNQLVD